MPSVFDTEGTARQSLREIVTDYGVVALDDERLLTPILTDLLAGHPREATLIRAAARVRVAELLRGHAANRIPVGTAIEDVTARLSHEGLIETSAARWIVTEYAVAIGHLTPEGTVPAALPAQGVARVTPLPPPPTTIDAPSVPDPRPASDPRPVPADPASDPRSSDPRLSDPRSSNPRSSDPRSSDPVGAVGAAGAVGVGAPARPAAPPVAEVPLTRPDIPKPAPPSGGQRAPDAPPTVMASIPGGAASDEAAPAPAYKRPPVVATVLAVLLPFVLGVMLIQVVPALAAPEDYSDRVHDQWLMMILPMTLTLIAVTIAMRGGRRAWLSTAAYAVAAYLGTAALPLIGASDSGRSLFEDLHLSGLLLSLGYHDSGGDLWLMIIAIGLTVLTHAVMKRLGLVRRVGLLTYVLTPVIVLLVNAVGDSGYGYVFTALHGSTSDYISAGLRGIAYVAYFACVAVIGLGFVPRLAGRR